MTSLVGLNLINFLIMGCNFQNMDFDEFRLLSLPTSVILGFCQGVLKNWLVNIINCFVN